MKSKSKEEIECIERCASSSIRFSQKISKLGKTEAENKAELARNAILHELIDRKLIVDLESIELYLQKEVDAVIDKILITIYPV